jgi:multisubunit Na+/H+ antiporter MnhB subunit
VHVSASEWNAFNEGIVVACAGGVVLLVMMIVRRKREGKPPIHLNAKAIGTVILGMVGTLALGICMVHAIIWENLMIPGISVGVVGILILMCLIPVYKGLK